MKILIVSSGEGDWEAVYIDGIKRYENHSVPNYILMDLVGGKEHTVEYFTWPELEDPDRCNPSLMFPAKWNR